MANSLTPGLPSTRRSVSPLGKLTAIALAGIALPLGCLQMAVFGFDPMITGVGIVILLLAALIFTSWRWTPLLALLPGLMLPLLLLPSVLGNLGAPPFIPGLVLIASSVLAVIAGMSAVVQNYRRAPEERSMPRAMPFIATAIVALTMGAALIGQIPALAPSSGLSSEMLASLPRISGTTYEFSEKEIRVKAGDLVAFRLENSDPETHFFEVDELNIHAPMPVGQTGVAIFKPAKPGTYTFYCAPHYNKETGEGMRGTLIVAPNAQ